MAYGDAILNAMKEYNQAHPDEPAIPQALVNKMLETNERLSRQSAQEKEREELVCRLLASGMPVDEVSLILKIRKEEISMIENNNAAVRIPDYAKKLAARRKSRERR
jgi:DNA-binding NarL/FixJ family response regulator